MNQHSSPPCFTDFSQYVGIPYVDKGTDPAVGLDCWQLIKHVYADALGVLIPDYMSFYKSAMSIREASACIALAIPEWEHVETKQPGDVLVFRINEAPWHTGMYLGNGLMLHTDEGHGSVVDRIDNIRWRNRFYGAYRWKS